MLRSSTGRSIGTERVMPTGTTTTRSDSKCEFCRIKKVKCLPEDRDWSKGEKCLQCQKSRRDCGPNTSMPRGRNSQNPETDVKQPRPRHVQPSPVLGIAQSGLRSRKVLVQQRDSPLSSSATLPFTYQPSNSPDENGTIYDRARQKLSKMGSLVELYCFTQQRHNAIINMANSLPPLSLIDIEAPLDFFFQKIGDHIIGSFMQLKNLRKLLTAGSPEWEIIGQRMVVKGQLFLNLDTHQQNITKSFRTQHANLKEELANYYQDFDGSEADRIRFDCVEDADYLQHCPIQNLKQVADRISSAMKGVLDDLAEKYKSTLKLDDHPIEITASHLALMFPRWHDIHPSECPPCGGTGLTGRNTYHLAAEEGNAPYLRYHLDNSPDAVERLSDRDVFGLTPIMVAAYSGNLEVFKILCEHKAPVTYQMPGGKSILSLACMAGHIEIIAEIFNSKISIKDHIRYCSPLHDAIQAGQIEVVNFLIEHGADPGLEFNQRTPTEWAKECEQPDIVHRLNSISRQAKDADQTNARPEKRKRVDSAPLEGNQLERTDHLTSQHDEFQTEEFEYTLTSLWEGDYSPYGNPPAPQEDHGGAY